MSILSGMDDLTVDGRYVAQFYPHVILAATLVLMGLPWASDSDARHSFFTTLSIQLRCPKYPLANNLIAPTIALNT